MKIVTDALRRTYRRLAARRQVSEPFPGVAAYWERRYATGGNSGDGSYGSLAQFKAETVNGFVTRHGVQSVIEFGCGDGHQLTLAQYPDYVGFDVSPTAVAACRQRFRGDPHKSFRVMDEYRSEQADLALSLDVIYHLVEEQVYERYMRTLFEAARRYVIIYSTDSDDNRGSAPHVKHRAFTEWIQRHQPRWTLVEHVPNRYRESSAEFFAYAARPQA